MAPGDSKTSYGREGENRAVAFLESEGWLIVARNYRAGRGEIDIVAIKGAFLAFVEVKRWKRNGPFELENSINNLKIHRIIETSKIFLSRYRQYNGRQVRYDVILLSPDGMPIRYEGAFDETV